MPCPHLRSDDACGIHAELRPRGYAGCTVFDCFGAGQHVVQVVFAGRSWRDDPATGEAIGEVFGVVRQLHELRWHVVEAIELLDRLPDPDLREELEQAGEQARALADAGLDGLAAVDGALLRQHVGPLLGRVSAAVRAVRAPGGLDRTGADLAGARLRGADLRGASLRGAWLMGADLRGADLRWADLLGTDLRGADLRGARLADALFVTAPQAEAAEGDEATTLPAPLRRPVRWSTTPV